MSADFQQVVLPHLDAAYNLARWLTRNEQAAEDLVQDSCVRALKSFDGYRGGDARAWILAIVRNTCYTWLAKNKAHAPIVEFNDEIESSGSDALDPAALAARGADEESVRRALDTLAPEFREVVVLRELEDLSYKEIAAVSGVPVGTVMSRLSRARKQLERSLAEGQTGGG
jgi:RNA polymerase sigma-70 factor (ECF subfamily)